VLYLCDFWAYYPVLDWYNSYDFIDKPQHLFGIISVIFVMNPSAWLGILSVITCSDCDVIN
jgi:hypothetical protein